MKLSVLFLLLIVLIAGCTSIRYIPEREDREETVPDIEDEEDEKLVYNGTIDYIRDGDTIRVDNVFIRLVLIDAPESNEEGYLEAREFFKSKCPIGSTVWIDEDDKQGRDKYGRLLAVVYCDGKNMNKELLVHRHAVIDERFCDVSEFGDDVWARTFGC
jgi:micrococcal nuclease